MGCILLSIRPFGTLIRISIEITFLRSLAQLCIDHSALCGYAWLIGINKKKGGGFNDQEYFRNALAYELYYSGLSKLHSSLPLHTVVL